LIGLPMPVDVVAETCAAAYSTLLDGTVAEAACAEPKTPTTRRPTELSTATVDRLKLDIFLLPGIYLRIIRLGLLDVPQLSIA
jgi:hypothetical protein